MGRPLTKAEKIEARRRWRRRQIIKRIIFLLFFWQQNKLKEVKSELFEMKQRFNFLLQEINNLKNSKTNMVTEIQKEEQPQKNDLTSKTESWKEYKSNLSFNMPVVGVVENGTATKEITDLSNIIFKRTKN